MESDAEITDVAEVAEYKKGGKVKRRRRRRPTIKPRKLSKKPSMGKAREQWKEMSTGQLHKSVQDLNRMLSGVSSVMPQQIGTGVVGEDYKPSGYEPPNTQRASARTLPKQQQAYTTQYFQDPMAFVGQMSKEHPNNPKYPKLLMDINRQKAIENTNRLMDYIDERTRMTVMPTEWTRLGTQGYRRTEDIDPITQQPKTGAEIGVGASEEEQTERAQKLEDVEQKIQEIETAESSIQAETDDARKERETDILRNKISDLAKRNEFFKEQNEQNLADINMWKAMIKDKDQPKQFKDELKEAILYQMDEISDIKAKIKANKEEMKQLKAKIVELNK